MEEVCDVSGMCCKVSALSVIVVVSCSRPFPARRSNRRLFLHLQFDAFNAFFLAHRACHLPEAVQRSTYHAGRTR